MYDWRRILQLRVFSEEKDVARGPRWSAALFLAAALIGYFSFAVAVVAILGENHTLCVQASAVLVGAFSILSGAAWHLGMTGRAKNGLILAIAGVVLILLIG